MNEKKIPKEIKWRGSTYVLVTQDGETIHWQNPVSKHTASCTVESWLAGDPYDSATD